MKQYHDYLKYVLENGIKKEDRTGTGTISIFGYQMRFDLSKGFPLVTTKKIHFKSIVHELLWFLSGDTNIKYLNDNGVKIWNEWADENGDLGFIYGKQWTNWENEYNQISDVINKIKSNPDSRRLIVNAWNVKDLPYETLTPQENVKYGKMALAPCHVMFQFYVKPLDVFERIMYVDDKTWDELWKKNNLGAYHDRESENYKKEWIKKATKVLDDYGIKQSALSCMLTMRSCDSFLGVPYNIASYSLLTHMIAQQCNLEVGEFIWSGGDCHIYLNHLDQVKEQLSRKPYDLPKLIINKKPDSIFDYKYDDFEILDYKAHPHIKGVVAI